MWRTVFPLVVLLAACGSPPDEPDAGGERGTTEPDLPASYSFDLASSCGERALLGEFHVTVVDDEVTAVEPSGQTRMNGLELTHFPTIADLVDLVATAGNRAIVETEYDADGIPTLVSIDHNPDGIDDEECYRISDFEEQREAGEPMVSCGGGPPGWAVSAMDGGIEAETPRDEIDAALRKTAEEMGMDGPFALQGPDVTDAPWFVLAETDASLTVATGTWGPDGPGEDAMTIGYDRTDDGLVWAGHGSCTRLALVNPPDGSWVQVTAPAGGLEVDATTVPVLVMEHECTSARDPRPFLHEPVVVESDDRVIVYWTTTPPTGSNTCPSNPSVEQSVELAEPLGDRPLLDGSTWPPTPIGSR